MASFKRRFANFLLALLLLLPAVQFSSESVHGEIPSLRNDNGLTGTLFRLLSTPAGDVLGADDRGLYKWTAAAGWKLLLEVKYTVSEECSRRVVRCYADPMNLAWGEPISFSISGGEFVVIEPLGLNGDIAIMTSTDGAMNNEWSTVHVADNVFVQSIITDGLEPPESITAFAYDKDNIPYEFVSNDHGSTWTQTESPMRSVLAPEDATPDLTIEEIEAENPGALGYLGELWDYLEVGSLRIAATFGGVFMSLDGAAWKAQSDGIPVHPRLRLLHTSFGNTHLAGGISEEESALFRSSDGGVNFTRVLDVPMYQAFSYMRMQSATVAYGSYEATDLEGIRYGPKIYRSVNGGINWEPLNNEEITFEQSGYAGQYVRLIVNVSPSPHLVVVTADIFGAYFVATSEDGGLTWDAQTEIAGCLAHNGEPHVDGDTLMLPAKNGAGGYGYCRSTDAGSSWSFVSVTSSSQFKPGSLLVQPDGSLLALSSLAPFVSDDDGASWSLKPCGDISPPIGPVESGEFDNSGALWAVYFDHTGGSLPNVFRSPDSGCSWDVTSVSNSLDDDLEDNVLDLEPDVDLEPESGLHMKRLTGSRTVRVIGVGNTGSTRSKVYWGPKPTAPRGLTAIAGKRTIALAFTAPITKGPGTLVYTSRCSSPGRRSTTVKSAKLTHLHKNLVSGRTYSCTVFVSNPMGNSGSVKISKKAG